MFGFKSWKVATIFGIPISIDPSWLIIFVLLTYELGFELFPIQLGLGRRSGFQLEPIILGLIASLLLFGSVLAHELSHAYMAIKRGVPVLGITLFIFGGVAQIGDEPDTPATEFLIAIMGPLMSFALAIFFAIFWIWPRALIGISPDLRPFLLPLTVVGFYLAQTNLLLALFNLLPGFPLDGGRVLRALVWAGLKNLRRATYIAMVTGRGIAALMALVGVWFVYESGLNGIWLVLIGFFVWRAAGDSYHAVVAREILNGVTVGRLMQSPVQRVAGDLNLISFVEQYVLRVRAPVFAVEDGLQVVGLIGAEQAKAIPRAEWASRRVKDVMVKLTDKLKVSPDDPALRAMQLLTQREGNELAVVQGGEVVGSIGPQELGQYLQLHGE